MSFDQLTEDDVVEAVCRHLESKRFTIEQRLTTKQQGDDIVAMRPGMTRYVEAKGATSARAGSQRFGRPFDSAQARVHVAEAVYKAIQVLARANGNEGAHAAVALPANSVHRREITPVVPILEKLGITVFWVKGMSEIEESGAAIL